MKYCSDKRSNLCLLAGLVALLLADYASAADKKLSPVQQLRSTNSGYMVREPAKVKPPRVPFDAIKPATIKPQKKSAGIKPVSPPPVSKKQPPGFMRKPVATPPRAPVRTPAGMPARLPLKTPTSSRQPIKPVTVPPRAVQPGSGFSRKVQPLAPAIPNSRNNGFAPSLPAVRRVPPPLVKQNRATAGSPSTSKRGFLLAPPGRPATGAGSFPQRGGFAPVTGSGRQTNLPVKRLNSVTGGPKSPAHRGGFVPGPVSNSVARPGERAPGRASANARKPSTNRFQNPLPGGNTSTSRPDTTLPFIGRQPRSKDDERSGEYANDIINDWAEDDMAIGGGKVPDPDGRSPSPGVGVGDGDITRMQSDGSKATDHLDGRTDTFDTEGGHLETSSGIKASPGANGGTDVEDRQTGVTGHFGAENVRDDAGEIKEGPSGSADLPDGGRITDESNGSISVGNVDGSTDTWQRDGSKLHTGPGIKTVATPDGGTDVIGPDGKYEAHFGGGETTTEEGKPKYIGGGTVQNPDGSKEQGKKPESNSSSRSDNSTDSSASDNGSDDNSSDDDSDGSSDDSDTGSDSNDDSSSDEDNADDSSDDGSDDDASSDEVRAGFGGGGDGGPEAAAKTTVDDRVSRMKGEKRDPESADDPEPGNGGSAPSNVSQPGPSGGHRGSPLARPSAEGRQPPLVNGVVTPTVKTRSSVGGGDCFNREGCDNASSGGFKLDPLNRDPVTNPGGR